MMKRSLYIILSVVLLASLLVFYLPSAVCQPVREEVPTPSAEGVLNLYGIDPWTLDPAVSSESTSHSYIMQLFSGLVRLDDKLEPVPDIAQ